MPTACCVHLGPDEGCQGAAHADGWGQWSPGAPTPNSSIYIHVTLHITDILMMEEEEEEEEEVKEEEAWAA